MSVQLSEKQSTNSPEKGESYTRNQVSIHFDHAESQYANWPPPSCIISDGPYGIGGFPGDSHTADSLADWYEQHIKAWSMFSTPSTTLWFWNTEVGWATVHPVLVSNGWEYRCCNIWDKGIGHIAGNANTQTLRKFPVVTEVCVHYVKATRFQVDSESYNMQEWLRYEWKRTGLPLRLANEACGVLNAATRKYLTADHLWYFPPVETFIKLVEFANTHGELKGRPYFSVDGNNPVTGSQWEKMRAKFKCEVGITNVWREPQVGGSERIRGSRSAMKYKFRSLHGSQKPLKFIDRIVRASTVSGDVVWEPFGGLCPGAVVSYRSSRRYFATEIVPEFYTAAIERLAEQ
ncbi:MAG: site-specific DNA-methyltransferase [Gemmatimonadetes bacterium]|nr:site-specific DNA-methyltransferase [Gemmatimonadota bacterium]